MKVISRKILLTTICLIFTICSFSKQTAFSAVDEQDTITTIEVDPTETSENLDENTEELSENILPQESIDSELFDDSEYEEYDVYTVEDDTEEAEEDTTEMIVLAPENLPNRKSKKVLNATIEKSYSFRSVEAFNTIWDSSDNFKTTFRTTPSLMQTAPSVIHAANYRLKPDENTAVYWGHSSLSSQDDVSVGFVGRLESSYDSGMKIDTKLGKLNVSTGIYESLETNNPAGGVIFSSDYMNIKGTKGSIKVGGGFYSNECFDNTSSRNSGGFFAQYKQGKFSIGTQIGQTESSSREGSYNTSLYITPKYQLSKSLSISSKIASHVDENYIQQDFGITYKPYKNNPNEVSFSVKATLYNGEGTENKQRLEFSTKFKL